MNYTNLLNKFIFLLSRERTFTARADMMSTGNSFKRIKHLPHTICNIVFTAYNAPGIALAPS